MNPLPNPANIEQSTVLQVTVAGGGPVGLSFALLLESLMGNRVAIKIFDGRWTEEGSQVVWKNEVQGNARRQQVVTIQSRQFLKLPVEVQNRIFAKGYYTEMWPKGPDSVQGYGPRNVRISHVENQLLEIANEKKASIQLVPMRFDPVDNHDDIVNRHVLAICEGSQSRTREYFIDKFGQADQSMYTVGGNHLQDVVLGLRVKSDLPDAMAVLLTVAQNRFLLNALNGDGFLNMRLTDDEIREVVGIDLITREFRDCIQSRPCIMERGEIPGEFRCITHNTLFLPALLRGSALWQRVLEGLKLFNIKEANLTAVTAFRLNMVQRPRFTTQLYPPTPQTPGTFGFLLGDAANAIHFWPGRGLNSGLVSAVSLARCLNNHWRNRGLRDADFLRHEAVMAMLQYRHKSRAWRAMVTSDNNGIVYPIKDRIKEGITEWETGKFDKEADTNNLLIRLRQIRSRLEPRLSGLPDDNMLRECLEKLNSQTLHTLVVSDSWNTLTVGGEEVEVDLLLKEQDLSAPVKREQPETGLQLIKVVENPVDATLDHIPDRNPYSDAMSESQAGSDDDSTHIPSESIKQPIIGFFVRVSSHPTLPKEWPIYDLGEARKIHIGRHSKNNTVVLDHKSISREHAMIVQKDNHLYLHNISKFGTYLNGKLLKLGEELLLRPKDLVGFGEVLYEFHDKGS